MNKRIEELEAENKKIRDEFNVQRAKMKDLFLQKEGQYTNFIYILRIFINILIFILCEITYLNV